MDKHNNHFIENLKYDEDYGLFAKWNMYYCLLSTNHIEEAEYDLF